MEVFGAIAVAILMVAAWFGGQAYAVNALDRWQEQSYAVSKANLDRSIGNLAKPEFAEEPMAPNPDKPFAAEHPDLFAGMIAIGTGIIGAVVVLLASIAASLHRQTRRTVQS